MRMSSWYPEEASVRHGETFRLEKLIEEMDGSDRKGKANAGNRGGSTTADGGRAK